MILIMLMVFSFSGCSYGKHNGPKVESTAYMALYDKKTKESYILEYDFERETHKLYKTDGYLFNDDVENAQLLSIVDEDGLTSIFAIRDGAIEPYDTKVQLKNVVRVLAYYDENLYYLRNQGKYEIVRADTNGVNAVYSISENSCSLFKYDMDPMRFHKCSISQSGKIIYQNMDKAKYSPPSFDIASQWDIPIYCANPEGENEFICKGVDPVWYNNDTIIYEGDYYDPDLNMYSLTTGETKYIGKTYFDDEKGRSIGHNPRTFSVNNEGAIAFPSMVGTSAIGTMVRGMLPAIGLIWPETGERSSVILNVPNMDLRDLCHVYWE